MIGVQDQEDLKRPLQHRVGLELAADLERHVDVVADIAQVVARENVGQPAGMAEGKGGDGGELGHQPDALEVAAGRILDVLGVGIERRQCPDRAQQGTHRVGIVAEALEELDDVGMDVGVVAHVVLPPVQLGLRGQLTLEQEVGYFEEAGLLCQLLDGVSAVPEDAFVAVDERDGAATAGGIEEGRVIGHEPEVIVRHLDLAQVHCLDRALGDRQLVGLAGTVVDDGQRIFGHEALLGADGRGREMRR